MSVVMKKHIVLIVISFSFLISFLSCADNSNESNKRIVFAIPSDVTTFSPLYAFNANEGNITELIYMGLVEHKWDGDIGDLTTSPMLAQSWLWSNDSLSLTVELRNDVYWSDSVQFNAHDIVFTFNLYSDAKVNSRFYGQFKNFYTNDDLSINTEKSFEVLSPFKIRINFNKNSSPTLFDISYPLLPKHIFEKTPREEMANAEVNLRPVGTGPYKLFSWEKNQFIKLVKNENSIFYNESIIPELIFKVVPDYNARINQLKNGEVDFADEIKSNDVDALIQNGNIKIESQKGRNYDYVGWNNIDPEKFTKNKIAPNKFFGNKNVRKALSYAVNSKIILEEFLDNYGELAVGPIAPIFKNSINQDLEPVPFDLEKAKQILENEGWKDSNLNGTIDKNGIEFSFVLNIPGGNPLRNYTSTIIKDNLKNIGIAVSIETVEPQVFWGNVFARKYDAWIAGWMVPIPLSLKPFWHSDLKNNPVNLTGYNNKGADILLEKTETNISKEEMNNVYKEIQNMLYNDAPVTFLFWKDNITAYNKKINGVSIDPLGVIHKCWNWSISN